MSTDQDKWIAATEAMRLIKERLMTAQLQLMKVLGERDEARRQGKTLALAVLDVFEDDGIPAIIKARVLKAISEYEGADAGFPKDL